MESVYIGCVGVLGVRFGISHEKESIEMAVKTRDPQELSDDDLVTFAKNEANWLAKQAGKPDVTPRAAEFPVLAAKFESAYNDLQSAEQSAPLIHGELVKVAKPLIAGLRVIQHRLPLVPDLDESTLAEFGLGEKVPTDFDKLGSIAEVCKAHWEDISGGGVPPEYAPIEANMAAMVSAAEAFIDGNRAYRNAVAKKQDAVALKNECRRALLECDREIFHWYKAAHWSGKDPWWRTTPWGCYSKKDEE